ncbi:MAG: DUF6585 family protein [Candidatus Kapaibacterium sp.]
MLDSLRTPPTVSLPDASDLGNLRSEHRMAQRSTLPSNLITGIGAVCFILGILFGGGMLIGTGLALAAVGVGVWYSIWRLRNMRALVYDGGIVSERNGNTVKFRWDDVVDLYESVTRKSINGIYVATEHLYTVHLKDGTEAVYGALLQNTEKIGDTIRTETWNRLMTAAIDAYEAGEKVKFGYLTVSREGLGNRKEEIPWTEVKGVQVRDGMVSVKKEGKWLSWNSTMASSIPNIHVFLTLVDRIVEVR